MAGSSTSRPGSRESAAGYRARLSPVRHAAAGLAVAIALLEPVLAVGIAPADLLPAERAFELSVEPRSGSALTVRFAIADGYYLYRDKLGLSVDGVALATAPRLPPGKTKDDPFFGRVEIYPGPLAVDLQLDRDRAGEVVRVVVESQGCAEGRVCYPAQRQVVAVTLPRSGERPGPPVEAAPRKKAWFN